MTTNDKTNSHEKTAEQASRLAEKGHEPAGDTPHGQLDQTNLKAVQEAVRLGGGDTYIVKSDLEDMDERLGEDMPDGRANPMANADNPER